MRLPAIPISFLVLLYVSLQWTPLTAESIVSYAITTHHWVESGSANTIKLTFWFDGVIYTDVTDFPDRTTTSTTLYAPAKWGSTTCDETRIMIENSGGDGVALHSLEFTTDSGVFYGIRGMCVPSSVFYVTNWISELSHPSSDNSTCSSGYSHLAGICVDNHDVADNNCKPSKQILYFNTSQPNQYITGATWLDASNVSLSSKSCDGDGPTTTSSTTAAPSDVAYQTVP
eukprot:368919_1